MATLDACRVVVKLPREALAVALPAKVVAVRVNVHEADERVQLANAVLQRRASQVPLEAAGERENGASGGAGTVLNGMC